MLVTLRSIPVCLLETYPEAESPDQLTRPSSIVELHLGQAYVSMSFSFGFDKDNSQILHLQIIFEIQTGEGRDPPLSVGHLPLAPLGYASRSPKFQRAEFRGDWAIGIFRNGETFMWGAALIQNFHPVVFFMLFIETIFANLDILLLTV